jgi:hypothetical protein
VAACQGGRLVVHFTNRKNAPFPLFHMTRDATLVLGGPHSSTIDGLRDGLRELGSRRASSSSSTCVIPKAM